MGVNYPQEIAMQIAAEPLQIDVLTQWRNHRLAFDWYRSRPPHPTRTPISGDVPQTANVNMLIAAEPLQAD